MQEEQVAAAPKTPVSSQSALDLQTYLQYLPQNYSVFPHMSDHWDIFYYIYVFIC